MAGVKLLRSEAYYMVRRNDEGDWQLTRQTSGEADYSTTEVMYSSGDTSPSISSRSPSRSMPS
jgi:hypothetical protein